jgi:hypothetical protein
MVERQRSGWAWQGETKSVGEHLFRQVAIARIRHRPDGKPVREVLLASLPAELQRRWAEQQRAATSSALPIQENKEQGHAPANSLGMRLNETLKR